MDLLVDGSIPPSSGLSSSSMLVCCVALVTVYANKLDKKRLVELHVHTKHYIGMDQAISFLTEPGKAKMIEFNPIHLSNVSLPVGTQFVISNCLIKVNKVAFTAFNERVMECHLAAQVISKESGLAGSWEKSTHVAGSDHSADSQDHVEFGLDSHHLTTDHTQP